MKYDAAGPELKELPRAQEVPNAGQRIKAEIERSIRQSMERVRRDLSLTHEEAAAIAAVVSPTVEVSQLFHRCPEHMTETDIAFLAMESPELANQCLTRIQGAARQELETGIRAAKALEGPEGGSYWEREQFQAMREQLVQGWKPAPGVEMMLIDTLAQAFTMQLRWTSILALRQLEQCNRHDLERQQRGGWLPPRVSETEAIEQAMDFVERWNRMMLRTTRTLRELRRGAHSVHIEHVSQANIGNQQINVAESEDRGPNDAK